MFRYGLQVAPWAWVFMALFWIVVIGLLVWAIIALLSRNRGTARPVHPGAHQAAEDILDRRFAMGEINIEQYRQARAELATARQERRP